MSTCSTAMAPSKFFYLGRTFWSTRVRRRRPARRSAAKSSWSRKSRKSGERPAWRSRNTLSERSASSPCRMLSSGTVSTSLSPRVCREEEISPLADCYSSDVTQRNSASPWTGSRHTPTRTPWSPGRMPHFPERRGTDGLTVAHHLPERKTNKI